MKKQIKYQIALLLSLLGAHFAYSQNDRTAATELLQKVENAYDKAAGYHVDVVYSMYKGLTGNTITETYKGKIIKKGRFTQFGVLDSEILQFPNVQLTIDHNGKNMVYAGNSGQSTNSPLETINQLFEHFNKVKVTESNGKIICEMADVNVGWQLPYGKVVLHVNKSNYTIEKQVLYFSSLIPFANENGTGKTSDYGRLIITFDNKELKDQYIPQLSDFVMVNSGQRISPATKYKGYNLINQAN